MRSPLLAFVTLLGLLLGTAHADTYYMATDGSDASPGTQAQPFRTMKKGVSVLRPGDTLYLRGGTYSQRISSLDQPIPSGTSWGNAITIAGAPGETVILKGKIDLVSAPERKYLILRDFVVDAAGQSGNGVFVGVQYVRLQNLEIKNYTRNGVQVGGNHNEFLHLRVHTSTAPRFHGFYVWGSDNLFDGIESYNNSGYGMQFYNAAGDTVHRNIIRNSRIHHNGTSTNNGGIVISHGDGNQVHHNVIYQNTNGGHGLDILYRARHTQAWNNTIYGNPGDGIYVGADTSGTRLTDNIVVSNGSSITDHGGDTRQSHNYTSEPHFVNASAGDFHLRDGSPAKKASSTGGEVGAYGGGGPGTPASPDSPDSPAASSLPVPRNLKVRSVVP
jgi:parallel beta-helix repeat protein